MKIHIDIHHHLGHAFERALLDKLNTIITQGENTMSKISEFSAKMDEHNAKLDAAVDGLAGDIKELNDKIAALQNSPGDITPEDQALLDAIEAKASSAADKVAALDDLTPPVVPPTV